MKPVLAFIFSLILTPVFSQGKFFGGNGDGFATATISNIVLPLEITAFSILKDGTTARASLTIVSTDAVCSIQLQSATDGINFRMIDSIESAYPGLQDQRFEFNDPSPANGASYYRIKIIRCDGSVVYSKIVLYRNDGHGNQFYVTGNSLHYNLMEKGSLELFNAIGQLVMKKTLLNSSGVLSVNGLKTGIYFLRWQQQPVKAVIIRE